jgi:hypothetical protein
VGGAVSLALTAERDALVAAKKESSRRSVRLHLEYHPQDPSSRELQKIWRSKVSYPYGETPIYGNSQTQRTPQSVLINWLSLIVGPSI